MKYEFLQKRDYAIGYMQENIEMFVYTAVCFFIPFFMGHPQLLVGSVVNAMLVMAAFNLKGYKLLPVIIAPSLGVLSKGLLFGPFTVFLIYMIPFIWIGNALLVYAFKKMHVHNKVNKWFTLIFGAGVKTLFLFLAAFALLSLGVLPKVFLISMGLFQFYTAMIGGVAALGVHAVKKKFA